MNKNINLVFDTDSEGRADIYPPAQVFVNKDFKFLIGLGGSMVDDEKQYDKLMAALSGIGETSLHIVEQKRKDEKEPAFVCEFPIESNYDAFLQMENSFDPIARWVMANIFVYGDNPNWGIYVCEYPTIVIIGCIKEYIPIFKAVYDIEGNGFAERNEFITWEYESRPHLREELIKNYRLEEND